MKQSTRSRLLRGCLLVMGCAVLASAAAADPASDLLGAEHAALGDGASSLWSVQDVGGSGIGGVRRETGTSGPRHLGAKLKAGLLSLVLPGAGQLYNGDRGKALAFAGAEAAVWTGYLVFHAQARGLSDDYREYAGIFADVGGDHTEKYWRAVGRYMTSEEYNESIERQARAEQVEPTGLITGADAWFWRSETSRENYQLLRADANRAYDRRDFTVLFALINRAVAVYDAVRGAGGDHMLEVAGFGIDVESRRVIGTRGTACVVSRSF